MMAAAVDVPSFLAALHAAAGDYGCDVEYNMNVLNSLRSAEYLLLMDGSGAFLTESMHAYRRGTRPFIVSIYPNQSSKHKLNEKRMAAACEC